MTEIKRRECLCEDRIYHHDRWAKHLEFVKAHPPLWHMLDSQEETAQDFAGEAWDRAWDGLEHCDMCGEDLAHDYVHWNGAFAQCESCSVLESLDPAQNGLDPMFGGTFSQMTLPIYGAGEAAS